MTADGSNSATKQSEKVTHTSLVTGEVAVLGLGRSGVAAARLLHAASLQVYVSDAGNGAGVVANAGTLQHEGIDAQAGGHDLARIARAKLVVVSPGIPPQAPPLQAARDAGVPIVSEVEIALRRAEGMRVIAVTGTNGKTTTTAMIGHLLRALGRDALDVGNIGTPVSEAALRTPVPEWASLEMSSFQLHDTPGLHPDVGVLTNLSPDHLDRYANVSEYYADKRLLFANADASSRWVITGDSAIVDDMVSGISGHFYRFSTMRTDVDAYYDRAAQTLQLLGAPIVARDQLQLPGDHNVANALAALLAVMIADPAHATPSARETLAAAIATFGALPHRLEPVHDANGILWLNDSKATNVSSTLVAIDGMTRPTVLLLGGRHKGEPYTMLLDAIRKNCRAVVAYGEAVDEIAKDLATLDGSHVSLHVARGRTFREVMSMAREIAQSGDVVLLSPACSSYDMFNNYEERGRTFAQLARELA